MRATEAVWCDLRCSVRSARRSPLAAIVAILSLAVPIAANTAVFGLIYALLFRAIPVSRPEELVSLRPTFEGQTDPVTYGDLRNLPRAALPRIEAIRIEPAWVGEGGDASEQWIDMVSGGYFDFLGIVPLRGRFLVPADEQSAAPVAVVGEEFWRQALGSDSTAVGRTLRIGPIAATIVGIAPREFAGVHFARRFSIAMPISVTADPYINPSDEPVTLIARRRPGHDGALDPLIGALLRCCVGQVSGDRTFTERPLPAALPLDPPLWLRRQVPGADSAPRVALVGARRGLVWNVDYAERYRTILLILFAGGGTLLFVACANVGTLLQLRSEQRANSIATRLAIGATRTRIAAMLLVECAALMLTASGVALVLARLASSWLSGSLPTLTAGLAESLAWRPSLVVFGFTALVALLCTLFVGLWPVLSALQHDIAGLMNGSTRPRRSRSLSRPALACAQVAAALVLVAVSALSIATVRKLTSLDGGYRTKEVLLARILGYPDFGGIPAMEARYASLLADASVLPGASGAALAWSAPVILDATSQSAIGLDNATQPGSRHTVRTNFVSPGFFAVSGIGIKEGREFVLSDDATSERVAIVSGALARRLFVGSPVNATIAMTGGSVRVVGVANDARYHQNKPNLRDTESEMLYIPLPQSQSAGRRWLSTLTLVVRAQGDARAVASSLQQLIRRVIPMSRGVRVTTVGDLLRNRVGSERMIALFTTLFGILAVCLAWLGVFATTSHRVTMETVEIGVRVALGASPAGAAMFVLKRTAAVATCGCLIGAGVAVAAVRVVRSQLFGVEPLEMWIVLATALALLVTAIAAALLASLRAASVDPAIALRQPG